MKRLIALAVAASLLAASAAQAADVTLLNVSYDPTRELYDHLGDAFAKSWKAGVTSIFVTHDQEEAFAVADLVAVMNKGRIEQVGTPADVRRDPRTAFVSEFLSA